MLCFGTFLHTLSIGQDDASSISPVEGFPQPAAPAADQGMRKKKKRRLLNGESQPVDIKLPKLVRNDDDTYSEGKRSTSSASATSLPTKKVRGFSWSQYLEQEKAKAAPNKLFPEVSSPSLKFHSM